MSTLKNDINRAVIRIHREQHKEWIPLKEIYKQVEEIRKKPNANNGASIRGTLETHCIKSEAFNGKALYDLKSKGTGLYKSIYYENILNIENIKIGEIFTREQLMNLFKISGQSGMMKTNSLDALVLISSPTNGTYEDSEIIDGKILYTGEGLTGDQQLNKNNKTLYDSLNEDLNIYLFSKDEDLQYIFEGRVRLYDEPYETYENDRLGNKRIVWKFPLEVLYKEEKEEGEILESDYSNVVNVIEKIEKKVKAKVNKEDLVIVPGPLKIRKYREKTEKKVLNRKTKPDYIAEEIIKNTQGVINERVIYDNEIRLMKKLKAYEQIEKMKTFFENKTENEGFDILSFELNKSNEYVEKYIEVKSTKGGESTPIDITDNELRFAKDHIQQYYLYRIIKSDSEDRYVKIVTGKELFENYKFVPTAFKIYSK